MRADSRSLHDDVTSLDYLRILRDLALEHIREFLGVAADGYAALLRHERLDIGRFERLHDLCVQFIDDGFWRAGWHEHRVPVIDIETRKHGRHRRQTRKRLAGLRRRNGERGYLSGLYMGRGSECGRKLEIHFTAD